LTSSDAQGSAAAGGFDHDGRFGDAEGSAAAGVTKDGGRFSDPEVYNLLF